jgi:nitrous oxide reductase accessory protein NosL
MSIHFPLEYTLENGSHVLVNQTGSNTFNFTITPEDGHARQFTYVEDGKTKTEAEAPLEFEEVDALRRFWLETEDI